MSGCVKSFGWAVLVCLFIVGGQAPLCGQSKKELEQKKEKLLREIEATNKQLRQVEKNKSATAAQLNELRKKISLRENLIGTINSELNTIGGEIATTSREIGQLRSDLDVLKRQYAAMIRYAYRNRNIQQQLMFVFAASDFNQAYKRVKYIQQTGMARRAQAAQIQATQDKLTGKVTALEQQRVEKNNLKKAEERQKITLEQERKEQDKLMRNLSEREKKLRKELTEKQEARRRLDRAIENIVRKEIEASRKKAVSTGGSKEKPKKDVYSLTPEAAKLSNSFSGNKGKLPWPVEQGSIYESFGEHPHKELKGIVVQNNGIDIHTSKGAAARAVFEGTVSGVVSIPGAGKAVIIRHGEYLSVYSNLSSVSLGSGDKVSTKQRIGTVANSSDGQKGELHLEIWKNTAKLNPASWITSR